MRESLKKAVELFENKPVTAVELGVAAGENAERIYNALNIHQMVLIDSWRDDYNQECKEWLKQTLERFADKDNVHVMQKEAIESAELFEDGVIDYLYIDDCHAPEHVYKELCAWYPQVSDGGMIAGHDWADNGRASAAVIRFCNERGILYFHAKNDGEKVADWWFIK
jgi:predicted O-methyltransferase YrrM